MRGASVIVAVVLVASCSGGSATDSTASGPGSSSSTARPGLATTGGSSEAFPVTIVSELAGPGSTGVFLSTANGSQAAFAEVNANGGIESKARRRDGSRQHVHRRWCFGCYRGGPSGNPIAMIYGTISTSTGARGTPFLEEANIPVVFGRAVR